MAVAIPFVPVRVGAGDYTDFQAVAGAGDNGKVWAWSDAQQKFVPVALNYEPAGAVATHAALTSGVHGISAFGASMVDDADASAARTTLGLGTAALANTGTSAGNVVVLDGSARLPAVDGSQLTNLPGGGGGTPGGSNTQVQYNNAGAFAGDAGLTYDAANDALTVVGRVVTGVIRPSADSATAVQVQRATGAAVITVDTTNGRVGIGTSTPNVPLQVSGALTATLVNIGDGSRSITTDSSKMRFYANAGYTFSVWNGGFVDGMSIAVTTGYVAIGHTATPTAPLDLSASTIARASARIRPGTAPTSPNDGDVWYDSRLKFRRSSTTEIIPSAAAQSAYTQTYSIAARTVNAYTTDAESSAYAGIDSVQIGNVYAQLSDLNSLRTAYENLRAMADNLLQVVNALIDDGQAFGMT